MTQIHKSLCWAASLIFLALGNRFGLIDDTTANTLFVLLPIVAVMSLRGRSTCRKESRA